MISEDDDEARAQEFIESKQIDRALEIYQRLRPQTARIFNIIAVVYAERKGDYESAIEYFKRALTLLEAVIRFRPNFIGKVRTIFVVLGRRRYLWYSSTHRYYSSESSTIRFSLILSFSSTGNAKAHASCRSNRCC